jgi:hypothetical protein
MKRERKRAARIEKCNPEEAYQEGREILLRDIPERKYRRSLTIGKRYKITAPPGNFKNTGMCVFIKTDIGKLVGLPFWCFLPTPPPKKV